MMISKIVTEHMETIAKIESDARKEKETLNNHEKELKLVMD